MEVTDPVAEVKARWTMPLLIEHLTGEPVPANNKIHSIFNPDDMTPSMHIYDDHAHDFSTGWGGDVIALVQAVKRCSFLSALEILGEEADSLKLDAVERPKVERPEFKVPKLYWHQGREVRLPAPRGVTDAMWNYLFDNRYLALTDHPGTVAIPHYHAGKIVGVKYRSGTGAKTAEPGSCFTRGLYDVGLIPGYQPAFIVEGESDCWALQGLFFTEAGVYALPSGAGTIRPEWFEPLKDYKRVYVCLDNDRAGNEARDKILRLTHWQFDRLDVPPMFNDVREAIAGGWKPRI